MFERVLVANRGVVARRVVRALNELGIESVVVYSEADAGAPHLAEASRAEPLRGVTATDTYLDQARLIDIAKSAGCDGIHPGYGFLSENAGFARSCEAAGIQFIGPSPKHIATMGTKTTARQTFAAAGFPVGAGSDVVDEGNVAAEARRIGFPVMLKPAAGGGGIGMRVVREGEDIVAAFREASRLAAAAFDDDAIYIEAFLERPRHVEFQIIGDGENVRGVFERDCSLQRRHQKVIEEAPAPGLDRAVLSRIEEDAVAAMQAIGYRNLGTVETLFASDNVGFLEVNTRLQVEHGVTEEITGVDLVQAQIRIAAGERLSEVLPDDITTTGHAVQVRVYAEDSERLLPSSGRLSVYRPPTLTGVRVEAGYQEGQMVTPHYDPLIAKIIGIGKTRAQAIGRALVGVRAFEIQGIQTNRPLLERTLLNDAFVAGDVHTGFLDDLL